VSYTITAADLFLITGKSVDMFTVGACVKIADSKLDIDVSERVVAVSKRDVSGKPGDVKIEIANKVTLFIDYGDLTYANDLDQVPGGSTYGRVLYDINRSRVDKTVCDPRRNDWWDSYAPAYSGLYLGADHYGDSTMGAEWKTYTDILGRAQWNGTDAYVHWGP